MNCLPPGSSVHGILQARILEYPFPSPGDLPDPGINQTWVSHIAGQILYHLIHKGSHSNKTFTEVLYTLLVDQELTHQLEITIPRNGSLQDKLSWLTTGNLTFKTASTTPRLKRVAHGVCTPCTNNTVYNQSLFSFWASEILVHAN